MALVLLLDEMVPASENHHIPDKRLWLTCVQFCHCSDTVFINVETIVWRGLLAYSFRLGEQIDKHLVVDVIDDNMWWRMKLVNLVKRVAL